MQITDFTGKVAVITGASRGIGKRLTQRFARAGARVTFAARRTEPLRALEQELRGEGHDVFGVAADVAVHEDCKRLIAGAIERWGRIDVLVNNAGISGVQKPVHELALHELDEVMRVNLYSLYSCIHFASPHMIAQRAGSIVNISSFTGKRPMAMRLPYATSKMALIGLTRTVALELAPYGIRCNAISPGPVEGERVEEVVSITSKARNLPPDEVRKMFLAWAPLNSMVSEDELCDMVFFLSSDSGRHMTGQDLNMDGGIVMY